MADCAVTKLGDVGLAERERGGGQEALDDNVVLVRHKAGVSAGAAHGSNALGGNQILDRDGNTGEGANRTLCREISFDFACRSARQFRRRRAESVQLRIKIGLPRQERFGDFDGRYFSFAHKPGEFDGANGEKIRARRCVSVSGLRSRQGRRARRGALHVIPAHCHPVDWQEKKLQKLYDIQHPAIRGLSESSSYDSSDREAGSAAAVRRPPPPCPPRQGYAPAGARRSGGLLEEHAVED